MSLPQETLGLRRPDFSSEFALLMPAYSLLPPPAGLTTRLHRPTECSPTTPMLRTGKLQSSNNQIANHTFQRNSNIPIIQLITPSVKVCLGMVIWLVVILCLLVLGYWNFQCEALKSVASVVCLAPLNFRRSVA